MANGDVQASVSAEYLQAHNLPISVSGMQKLQSFQQLQILGYNGMLGSLKKDFHGLQDFYTQMEVYSSVNHILEIAWNLIKDIVPLNLFIERMLVIVPGLGTVGDAFLSIGGFGQIFSLSPGDTASPEAISAKTSVYQNAPVQTSV